MLNNILKKELNSYKDFLLEEISKKQKKVKSIEFLLNSMEESSKYFQSSFVFESSPLPKEKDEEKIYGYVPPKSTSKKVYTKKDLQNNKQLILSYVAEVIRNHQTEELTSRKIAEYLEKEFNVTINGGDAYPSVVLANFMKASHIKCKDYHVRNAKSNLVKVYSL